ncbi:hypothetical protein ElyMa_004903900 [Elysia marginata]|uniref:Uncharacterized protein n=1 Tax=Elysia marginata TaxID=1093978 RepID=A0AAV4IV29_9GAST|nr:hypothetical protein ElyMa_004903900 [Elysia marginata]
MPPFQPHPIPYRNGPSPLCSTSSHDNNPSLGVISSLVRDSSLTSWCHQAVVTNPVIAYPSGGTIGLLTVRRCQSHENLGSPTGDSKCNVPSFVGDHMSLHPASGER